MKRLYTALIFLLTVSSLAFSQTKVNPQTQIKWPTCSAGSKYYNITTNTCDAEATTLTIQHNSVSTPSQTTLNFLDTAPSLPVGSTSVTFTNDGSGGLGGYIPPNVNSLNSLTGSLNLVGDSSITITPSGTNISLHATGAGGSGIQYNPSTTVYYFLSSSILADDNRITSTAIPAGLWNCNGTICDVNTTSAHNLTTNSWVDLTGLTGWFTGNPYGGQQDTGFGSFKIASVISSTEFTVAYTRNIGSGSGGNIYDASYWGVYMTAQEPFLNGHGTVLYWWSPLSSAATNFNSFVSCAANPTYVVIEAGQNDIAAAASATTIEGNLQTIWSAAHTAGCKVIQGTILPTNYGISVTDQMWQTAQDVNQWIRGQGTTQANLSTKKYWDQIIDFASYGYDTTANNATEVGNQPGGSKVFATNVNDAFGHQGGHLANAPTFMPWEGGTAFTPQNWFFLGNSYGTYTPSAVFDMSHGIWRYYQYYGTGGTSMPLFEYNWSNAVAGNHICNQWQVNTTTNNSFGLCLGYAGSGLTNNYFGIAGGIGGTTDIIKAFADGSVAIPALPNQATIGTDANGKLIAGAFSTTGTVTYTTSTVGSTSDQNKLVVMNCTAACSYTLPATQPTTTWSTEIVSTGSVLATIVLGGSDTFNGTVSLPILNSFKILKVRSNTNITTDYLGDAPLVAGTNVTFTQSANGLVVNSTSSSIANTTTTVGTTAISRNTCTTATTLTMTGVTTGSVINFTPSTDISGVTGWGTNAGLTILAWPTANTVNYKVCNQTASSITPSASVTFNVGVR